LPLPVPRRYHCHRLISIRSPPPLLSLLKSPAPADRCALVQLEKYADTRANFSLEAGNGSLEEGESVDVSWCRGSTSEFANAELAPGTVVSGVDLRGADFSGVRAVGSQMSRANARGANLRGADFTDVNAYETDFSGADLRDANFENAILSSARFGRLPDSAKEAGYDYTFGEDGSENAEGWARLEGARFAGALVSTSDVQRLCENPTLDAEARGSELGCPRVRK